MSNEPRLADGPVTPSQKNPTLPEAILAGYESRRQAREQDRLERERREAEAAPGRLLQSTALRFASWSSDVYGDALQTHGRSPEPNEYLERFLSLTPAFQEATRKGEFTDFWAAMTAAWGDEARWWYEADPIDARTVFATEAGTESFRSCVNRYSGCDFESLVREYLFVRGLAAPIRLGQLVYGLVGTGDRRPVLEWRFPEVKELRDLLAEHRPDWGFDSPTIQHLVKSLAGPDRDRAEVENLPVRTVIELIREMLAERMNPQEQTESEAEIVGEVTTSCAPSAGSGRQLCDAVGRNKLTV